MAKYEVIHPVNNGRLHPRGSVVELNPHDGATLHSLGHVKPLVASDEASADLESLTKDQLVSLAFNRFGTTLKPALTKAELISHIEQIAAAADKV